MKRIELRKRNYITESTRPETGSLVIDQAATSVIYLRLHMPLCSSSSSTGFGPLGRRPLQRKVVVIGDGGCGKVSNFYLNSPVTQTITRPHCECMRAMRFVLSLWFQTQRIHAWILHTNIVCSQGCIDAGTDIEAANLPCSRITFTIYIWTTKLLNLVYGTLRVSSLTRMHIIVLKTEFGSGQEDFDRLRSLSYAETHIVMLCFSVGCPAPLLSRNSSYVFFRSTARRRWRTWSLRYETGGGEFLIVTALTLHPVDRRDS